MVLTLLHYILTTRSLYSIKLRLCEEGWEPELDLMRPWNLRSLKRLKYVNSSVKLSEKGELNLLEKVFLP